MNSNARILLVEDNADDVILATRLFEKCGVADQVAVANNGQEALDFIFGSTPSDALAALKTLRLILLDLNLPGVHGVEIIRRLSTDPRTAGIPVVVLTVSGFEKEHLEKEELSVNGYLRKPLELHDFLNLCDAYLQKKP